MNITSPKVLKNPAIKKQTDEFIREPGGLHEWFVVSQAGKWRTMGYSIQDIKDPSVRTNTRVLSLANKNVELILHSGQPGGGGNHPHYSGNIAKTKGVLNLHTTIRSFADHAGQNGSSGVRVNGVGGINALPSAFKEDFPQVNRLVRMPFRLFKHKRTESFARHDNLLF